MPYKVAEKRCSQCLFSKNRIVSLARKREILAICDAKDTYFNCHKTDADDRVCCRGFFDTRPPDKSLRFARELGIPVKFVKVEP